MCCAFTKMHLSSFCTCRLLSGSIFITGPMVLRGSEISMLWLGISGVWMGRGLVGIIPKLYVGNKQIMVAFCTSIQIQLLWVHQRFPISFPTGGIFCAVMSRGMTRTCPGHYLGTTKSKAVRKLWKILAHCTLLKLILKCKENQLLVHQLKVR